MRMKDADDPEIIISELKRIYDVTSSARKAREQFDSRDQEEGESVRDYMDALRALHHEMDSKASLVGINDAVYRRFYDGLKDVELVTVSAKRIIRCQGPEAFHG